MSIFLSIVLFIVWPGRRGLDVETGGEVWEVHPIEAGGGPTPAPEIGTGRRIELEERSISCEQLRS